MVQFIASPVLLHRNFLSTVLANGLYGVALSYYHYLNFLGYSALPFLQHTEVSGCTLLCSSPHAADLCMLPVLMGCLVVWRYVEKPTAEISHTRLYLPLKACA